jgi:uncharacterized repeat protein (TIGR03803 family)
MPSCRVNHSLLGAIAAAPGYSPRRSSTWIKVWVIAIVYAAAALTASAQAQHFGTLEYFGYNGASGSIPYYVSLVQGPDGKFYGTTVLGGVDNGGTVFNITPSGTLTTLYSFCNATDCPQGREPYAGLVIDAQGNFYGTTQYGGTSTNCFVGCGTIFKITPQGALITLHSFDYTDGWAIYSPLTRGTDGNFYGSTSLGPSEDGFGTIFKITPDGVFTTLYEFTDYTVGFSPSGALLQANDGNFYGVTNFGGAKDEGVVFKITPAGALTTLYTFCSLSDCVDGAEPYAGLAQGTDGNLYGTTLIGGSNRRGTVFKLTLGGILTTLHSFDGNDGLDIYSPVIQTTDGNFYGMAFAGGNTDLCQSKYHGCGTIFKIAADGTFTTLHLFQFTQGANPYGGLVQGTSGIFYGVTSEGGPQQHAEGTVFDLGVGLGPFVTSLPSYGVVGATVSILGTTLAGATNVTFNGTHATFTAKAKTLITATVPAGATTGNIQVTTPNGTLTSNIAFTVEP